MTQGKVVFTGKRVILRQKLLEDGSNDFAWRVDKELSRFDATEPISMSYRDFMKYFRDELSHTSASSKKFSIDTKEGRHIGNCMYYDIDHEIGQAELGIMIGDRNYWGKGYGTDCVRALLGHIFLTTSLNKVYLHTLNWNYRARHAFAKAGFLEIMDVKRGGMNFVKMEIDRDEWTARCEKEPRSIYDGDSISGELFSRLCGRGC